MQVRWIGGGLVSGPTSSLCVIQSHVIGGGKETGATKPMTESRSEEEGVGSGHWCWQWLPAHVFFTGWQVQRSAWRWSSPWSKKRSKHNTRTAACERQSAFCCKARHLHDIATLPFFSQLKEEQLSARGLWSDTVSLASVNNAAHVLVRPGLHDRGRQTLCRRLEVNLYHIYLHGRWRVVVLGGAHPVNMPLRQEQCESGVWQPQRCSRLWSTAPSQATQSDSAVMKSETHGGLYVIISGSLKLDREWLSWMVIVTLPPWETSRALRLLHRDIQSYSLLHIMELSSQRANGSDPFNLCQKHTDEEVPNARPLPWGRHTPPLAAPFLLLDSLTGAPHLSSFTVQSGETARLASPPAAPHATAACLPHTRTQPEWQTRMQ